MDTEGHVTRKCERAGCISSVPRENAKYCTRACKHAATEQRRRDKREAFIEALKLNYTLAVNAAKKARKERDEAGAQRDYWKQRFEALTDDDE